MIIWHLEFRKVSSLKNHPKNARTLSKLQAEHLQISLEKFGLIDKPIINLDGMIIGGHQRKRILKKLGIKEIECWVPDRELTEKEVDELNIRLNRNIGDWDFEILANEWDPVEIVEYGFDPIELLGCLDEEESEPEKEDKKKKTTCPSCGHEF